MLAGLQFGLIVGAIAGRSPSSLMSARSSAARWRLAWRCSSSGATGSRSGSWWRSCRRPVRRGQYPDAQAGGQVGRAASGLAVVRAVGLRLAVRLCRHAGRGAGGGGDRGADALWHGAISASLLFTGQPAGGANGRPPLTTPPETRRERQLAFDLPVRSRISRADFFVSPANALALVRWTAGAAGRAARCCWSGRRRRARPIWRRSGLRAGAAACRPGPAEPIWPGWPPRARVVVEDADRAGRRPEAETALFHLHNHAGRAGGCC
jgi:hypothetical protein